MGEGILPTRDAPRYRIRTVVQLTGVPAPTLRSWERRYGVPSPERSTHAYRLYDGADVHQIREMKHLMNAGLSASEAARGSRQRRFENSSGDAADRHKAALLDAAQALDPAALSFRLAELGRAEDALGVYDHILVPTLHRAGLLWEAGRLGIDEEHLLSRGIEAWLRKKLDAALPLAAQASVVLGCLANDEHSIGLYGAALRLARWNVLPLVLGAATPPQAVHHAVQKLGPQAVALASTICPPEDRLVPLLTAYREAIGERPWLVGGPGARTMADRIRALGGQVVDEAAALGQFARLHLGVARESEA